MKESDGDDREGSDEISLPGTDEEHLEDKENFEIQLAEQNLFLIVFDSEEDLETVMEGRPWLFHKNLVLFDRLIKPIERNQIRLISSPFWIKIGSTESLPNCTKKPEDGNTTNWRPQDKLLLLGLEEVIKNQEEGSTMKKIGEMNESINTLEKNSNVVKKTGWKRIVPGAMSNQPKEDNTIGKRKSLEFDNGKSSTGISYEDGAKRLKHEETDTRVEAPLGSVIENLEQNDVLNFYGSAIAKRQADWTQ
ncbi:hypothetical protein PVK06_017470 [Gossypium arboreum]|uniref:DUF4283 domain-containing protein n=1 Tax=Gossypium arboreum TaxID=29729 RepID=A0ABR0Q3X9_GOSAR|nr:hypothetical protein PVK06_017470 [Gossypium arboreum]